VVWRFLHAPPPQVCLWVQPVPRSCVMWKVQSEDTSHMVWCMVNKCYVNVCPWNSARVVIFIKNEGIFLGWNIYNIYSIACPGEDFTLPSQTSNIGLLWMFDNFYLFAIFYGFTCKCYEVWQRNGGGTKNFKKAWLVLCVR